jgi:hypothetical protein
MSNYEIWRAEFPVQPLGKFDDGRLREVDGAELHGAHRCIVVAKPERLTLVIPLTSAQNSRGAEKWPTVRKSWLRIYHDGKPAYAMFEQMRALDDHRFNEQEGELGEHDSQLVETKLKALLNLI